MKSTQLAALLREVAQRALETPTHERGCMDDDFQNGARHATARLHVRKGGFRSEVYSAMAVAQALLGMPQSFGKHGDWTVRPYICLWMADELDNMGNIELRGDEACH